MSRLCVVFVCVLCLQHPAILNADETPNTSTIAGTEDPGFSGDGGPANEAKLMNPEGLFLDDRGVLYIADTGNQRVRRVGLDGIIETISGNGDAGFSGDGEPATQALLHLPTNGAVDSKGNTYIADTNNNRIRVVDGDGIITTFAGLGTTIPSPLWMGYFFRGRGTRYGGRTVLAARGGRG